MEIKKISELPVIEEMGEKANILVEENGETKRIPADKAIPDGGGSDFFVEIDSETHKRITPFPDILAAHDEGKQVKLRDIDGSIYNISGLEVTSDDESEGVIFFVRFEWRGTSKLTLMTAIVPPPSDGSLTGDNYTISMETGK